MPTHRETRLLPYSQGQVFDLVADVEKYPEFLPWCVACRIKARETPTRFTADMAIGFKMVREKFTSRVTIARPDKITVEYLDGPFKYLVNTWEFKPTTGPDGKPATAVEFYLEFEFRSKLLQSIIGLLFEEAVRRMVAAFETRAAVLYASANSPAS
ncbi:MAG: type II toxin-antitoxin system RatA family toxin [Rhodospirillaceae bacterium]|nr:type II toxin-antitoxin system RatA family toxin [Rhodospirillaceae bacterium]